VNVVVGTIVFHMVTHCPNEILVFLFFQIDFKFDVC